MIFSFEKKDGLSCVEFIYKAVAGYYSIDYELAFISSWSFSYDLNTCIASSNEDDRDMNLKKYHGLQVTTQIASGQDAIYKKIKDILLEKKICMIYTDLYYIPWVKSCYERRHWSHAVLITDITEKGYYCYDYYSTTGEILPFDQVPEQIKISFFDLVTPTISVNDSHLCKTLLMKVLKDRIENCNAFIQMELFAKSLNDAFDIRKITSDSEIFENSMFINSINRIAQCRFQFASVLTYMNKRFPELDFINIVTQFEKSAVSWKAITALLMKAYLLPDNAKIINKVSHKVSEVRGIEECIYNKLMAILRDHSFKTPTVKVNESNFSTLTNSSWRFVDVQKFLNHKAFGDEANTQQARYEDESFMLLNSQITDDYLSFGELQFKLGDLRNGRYDNIECSSQIIDINTKCSEIAILANAEYDHQIDYMDVWEADSKHTIEISTTSWQCTPVLGDIIVWRGIGGIMEAGRIIEDPTEKRLFGKAYLLPNTAYVRNIILPHNPNFHIFAISVR